MLTMLFTIFTGLSVVLFLPEIKSKLKPELKSQLWVFWLFAIFFIFIYFFGIEVSLFNFMIITGIFYLYDWFVLKRAAKKGEKGLLFHLVDFFPILIIIWIIRSFLFQPYHVPTGSLEPTIRPGDFLLVNQFDYGVKMPIWRKTLLSISEPKRGDIVVFFPPGGNVHFVKRLIGLPGDVIQYKNKTLFINGKEMQQHLVGPGFADDPGVPVTEKTEQLGPVAHEIFINNKAPAHPESTWIVPKGEYFMMGDNRDFSGDSRVFGFVPERNIVGRPIFVWFSIDQNAWRAHDWRHLIRWNRIGAKIA